MPAAESYKIYLTPVRERGGYNDLVSPNAADIGWEWEVRLSTAPPVSSPALAAGYHKSKDVARNQAEMWAEALLAQESYLYKPVGGKGVSGK